ncbi:hypothetical protein CHUAL_006118 [Chamberlinius hualienensis]
MVKQEKISSFFKRSSDNMVPLKRTLTTGNDENPTKKQRTEPARLSVEQRETIEDNRTKALIKKTVKDVSALHENIGISWFKALEPQFSKPYFKSLSEFVTAERNKHTVYPPHDKVYTWTHHFDIDQVKVVILGQDPYHQPNQAHGLCFSVEGKVTVPPSLVNIFTELKSDIPGFVPPGHGNLLGWVKQGVLLLNACLTVRASCPNSHKDKGWEEFTNSVISWIANNLDNVVFILWGEYAKKKQGLIKKKTHYILTSPHPSPFSARNGFFGCQHFSKTNEFLVKHKKTPIDWVKL